VLEDGERNWLDAIWRWVGFCVAIVLAAESEVMLARGGETWVRGPHSGKRLANGTYCIFHGARADLFLAWVDEPMSVFVRKDLDEGNGIFNPLEGRIQRVSDVKFWKFAPTHRKSAQHLTEQADHYHR
jgi:hypothetical protein